MHRKKGMSWESTKVYDWKNYLIPARPSKSELKVIEEYILKLKKERKQVEAAILGSTVEFRSICHKHKLNVTVIEFSQKHYNVLSKQPMEYRGKEILRLEDWRTMSTEKKYHLILGDLVFNGASKVGIVKILRKTSQSLSKDGYCILRTWVRRSNKKYNLDEVINDHRKNRSRMHFYTSCLMPIYMCFYDFKDDRAEYPVLIKGLKEAYKRKKVTRKEYLYCYNRWKREGYEFTIPLKKRIERIKSKYFKIEAVRYGKDCFRLWAPLYILRKK